MAERDTMPLVDCDVDEAWPVNGLESEMHGREACALPMLTEAGCFILHGP